MDKLNISPRYFFYVAMMVVLHYEVSRLINSLQTTVDEESAIGYYGSRAIKFYHRDDAVQPTYGRNLKFTIPDTGTKHLHHRHVRYKGL
jgi:hypothetical protein